MSFVGVRLSSSLVVRKSEFRIQDAVPRLGDVVGWASRLRERRTCRPNDYRVKIVPVHGQWRRQDFSLGGRIEAPIERCEAPTTPRQARSQGDGDKGDRAPR